MIHPLSAIPLRLPSLMLTQMRKDDFTTGPVCQYLTLSSFLSSHPLPWPCAACLGLGRRRSPAPATTAAQLACCRLHGSPAAAIPPARAPAAAARTHSGRRRCRSPALKTTLLARADGRAPARLCKPPPRPRPPAPWPPLARGRGGAVGEPRGEAIGEVGGAVGELKEGERGARH